ncbi:MAG: matrixin family metalloprotease [Candidatus Diapherotrites archaeon]
MIGGENVKKIILVLLVAVVILFSVMAVAAPAEGKGYKRVLEKRTFIHYGQGYAKPPWAGGGNGGGATKCYGFISNGAKWKTNEPTYVNPSNDDGMSESFVMSTVGAGHSAWETYGGDIFGNSYVDYTVYYNTDYADNLNTVSFGYYPNSGVIGVTTVWGYFSGPPKWRELVEYDLLFNDSFLWGNVDSNPNAMDLENIGTHEIGHAAGMGDMYQTDCSEVTMYGYSTEGETKKRSLEADDITGIQELYN